jgi:hypothetical protein
MNTYLIKFRGRFAAAPPMFAEIKAANPKSAVKKFRKMKSYPCEVLHMYGPEITLEEWI